MNSQLSHISTFTFYHICIVRVDVEVAVGAVVIICDTCAEVDLHTYVLRLISKYKISSCAPSISGYCVQMGS